MIMKQLVTLLIICSLNWCHAQYTPEGATPPLPCPKNEVYESCLENLCIAKRCSDLGYPLNCTKVDPKDCTSGCICKPGYLRNGFGQCIPLKYCPSCGGDPHATLGCSNYCKHSCSDYKEVDKICPPGCIQNGCQCRPGYVYHEVLKRCVRPKNCPKTCGPNAIRIRCVIKCPPTCSNPNPKLPCPCKDDCTKLGCKCISGYILDKIGGKCIKIKDCPKCRPCNGDPNAYIKECPNQCPPTCDDPNPVTPCPDPCYSVGCDCRPGYIRETRFGPCIDPNDCYNCDESDYEEDED